MRFHRSGWAGCEKHVRSRAPGVTAAAIPPETMWGSAGAPSPEFGHDKAPLSGGGCYLYGLAFFRHRAFRLGRECSGLMTVREGLGALFLLACAAHGQNGDARTRQVRPSLAGQALAALSLVAFWPGCWAPGGNPIAPTSGNVRSPPPHQRSGNRPGKPARHRPGLGGHGHGQRPGPTGSTTQHGQELAPAHQARSQKHQRSRKKKGGRLIRNE